MPQSSAKYWRMGPRNKGGWFYVRSCVVLSQKQKVGWLPKVHLVNHMIFILESMNAGVVFLICVCWAILYPRDQSTEHREWPFSWAVECSLLEFSREVVHLCLSGILACDFLFLKCLWIWLWSEDNAGLVQWSSPLRKSLRFEMNSSLTGRVYPESHLVLGITLLGGSWWTVSMAFLFALGLSWFCMSSWFISRWVS